MNKLIKLILLFVCEMIVVVSAFLIADKILDYRYEKKIQDVLPNNTRSEESSSRFGCSRKTNKNDKEVFYNTVNDYLEMLRKCDKNLTFDKVDTINNFCKSNSDDKTHECAEFNNLNIYIDVFSNVAKSIKEQEFAKLSIDSSDEFYKELQKNIAPLLQCSDDPVTLKKYKTFVSLIENGTIKFSEIKSFAGVLELYEDSETKIENKIDSDEQLAKQQTTCNNYYNLMKECGEELTFTRVDEIYDWVKNNENNPHIKDDNEFKTIEKYIHHYKEAADAIRGIKYKINNAQSPLYFSDYMNFDEIKTLNSIRWNSSIPKDFAKKMKKSCYIMTASARYNKGNEIISTDEDYRFLINLILADTEYDRLSKIEFKDVNSFYDVNKLYEDNRDIIKTKIANKQ